MIVEDFIMLGTTVPEPNSDGRVFVCSAGYSSELRQLLRVYPLARFGAPHRWSVNTVHLERNSRDSRDESWKIAGDRTPDAHADINDAFTQHKKLGPAERVGLLDRVTVESIAEANERRLSLAVINPKQPPHVFFEYNRESPDAPELRLFDIHNGTPPVGAKRFAYIPRISFEDAGGEHHLMLRDWGSFEFMRKHGDDRRNEICDALHIGDQTSLLVGNLNNQRNAWLVISVLNGLHSTQRSLFEEPGAAA